MKVIGSKILVTIEKDGMTQKTGGGFEVPVGQGEFEVAKVQSVGPEVEGVSEGDTIYVYTGSGKEFTHELKKYRVITTSEVIVVL